MNSKNTLILAVVG